MENSVVDELCEGMRLDRYIRHFIGPINQSLIENMLRKKDIVVNGSKVKSSYRMCIGDEVSIYKEIVKKKCNDNNVKDIEDDFIKLIKDSIIHMDDNIIAFNKPAGVSVQGGSGIRYSMDDCMEYFKYDNDEKPRIIHRLDRDTTGVVVFARNRKVASDISRWFRDRTIEKEYLAKVHGVIKKESGIIKDSLTEKVISNERMIVVDTIGHEAITNFSVLERDLNNKQTLVKLIPKTGRKHQIRVHLKHYGNCILGDKKYGIRDCYKKLHLHAWKLYIPFSGGGLKLEADLPYYFND